ncbi:hypothetical protein FJ251_09750 [bacterium]|nr:hypothetical protein [bacterium]
MDPLAFALTRRLWFVFGIHLGWNFLQDGVLGLPNSGITALPSWLAGETSGPRWLSGGSFGLESSLVSVLLRLAVAGLLLVRVVRRRQFVSSRNRKPFATIDVESASPSSEGAPRP